MADNLLFTNIFFCRLNHLGYGKENLWRYNGYDSSHKEKLERIWSHKRRLTGCEKCGDGTYNSYKNAYRDGNIVNRFKNTG